MFAFTTTYQKRRFFKRPRKVVYIDGPFFAGEGSVKERAESLRGQVYAAMCERAKLNTCTYCEYYKVGNPRLAAVLNGAQDAASARGANRAALKKSAAEAFIALDSADKEEAIAILDKA